MSEATGGRQEIFQFASDIRDFSSQYGNESSISYVVSNLVGPSNIYPNYGDFTQACVFRTYGPWWNICPSAMTPFKTRPRSFISEDFVELYFAKKVFPTQVDVYETFNPGGVVRILACDDRSPEHVRWAVLWKGQEKYTEQVPRIFSRAVKLDFPTNIIRLELNHQFLQYYTELDAVGLHGYEDLEIAALPGLESCVDPRDQFDGIGDFAEEGDLSVITAKAFSQLHIQEGLSAALDATDNGFFDLLPDEVIQEIISYLDLHTRCILSCICRLLHKHCYDPFLYMEVDLQPYWHLVQDSTLIGLESRCDHLQRLNLSWCSNHDEISQPVISRFIETCSTDLRCLRLACCKIVNNDVMKSIELCKNLSELDLQGNKSVDSMGYLKLTRLTQLRKLNLYRTIVDVYSIVAIIRSCPLLEDLNLGSCSCINNFDDVAIELANNCKELRCLDMWRARTLTDVGLFALASSCHKLEELDLGWCSGLQSQSECLRVLFSKCPNLKKIFLTANRTVSDEDLDAIAKGCPKLEQLDILGTREVSQQMALKVLQCCTELKFFDVSFCAGITFQSVEQWTNKFPHVSIKKSYQQ